MVKINISVGLHKFNPLFSITKPMSDLKPTASDPMWGTIHPTDQDS
jgi:hypothetical protein